jgi:histidinol phosphatase-like PHP family hydrolase
VRTGRALVLASDAHRLGRGAVLTHAVGALAAAGVPRDQAERLTREHPAALLTEGLPAAHGVVA